MRCPFCKKNRDRVVDSRTSNDGTSVRRRRKCLDCRRRFTTYERVEMTPRMVVKKDGAREVFSREKIMRGVAKACDKRAVPLSEIEALVDRVEAKVYDAHEREVPAQAIGEAVIQELRALDEIAYVRFASVYRRFKDVGEIEKLLATLPKKDGSRAQDS